MYIELLQLLIDPITGKPFRVLSFNPKNITNEEEIIDGILIPQNETYYYPIINRIPRLLVGYKDNNFDETYHDLIPSILKKKRKFIPSEKINIESFSKHWKELHSYQIEGLSSWGTHFEQTCSDINRIFDFSKRNMNGKWVLDAGCGNGVNVLAFLESGVHVIAMDITESVDICQEFVKKNLSKEKQVRIHFIQASIENPCLLNNSIDIIFSHGVLHHTKSTRESFFKLANLVKKNGQIYIWVYRKNVLFKLRFSYIVLRFIRYFLRRLDFKYTYIFSKYWVSSVRFLLTFLTRIKLIDCSVLKLSYREHLLGTYDKFSAYYQWHHTYDEVKSWFYELDFSCKEVRGIHASKDYKNYGVSLIGIKH